MDYNVQHPKDIDDTVLQGLAAAAWNTRENAHILGNTKVGCSVLTDRGRVFGGCNVEHMFRCHDVHAEVNAISSMVSSGDRTIIAVVIVAERDRFTPCGGCMDWIMQFGSEDTVVAFQPERGGPLQRYSAHELMPHYPR